MRAGIVWRASRVALLALLVSVWAPGGAAWAQESADAADEVGDTDQSAQDDTSADEGQSADAASQEEDTGQATQPDEQDGADATGDEAGAADSEAPEDADAGSLAGAQDAADAAGQDAAAAEFMTQDWAPPVSGDESDDAVPTNTELDPTGLPWQVVGMDVEDDAGSGATSGSAGAQRPGSQGAGTAGRGSSGAAARRSGDLAGPSFIPIVRPSPPGTKPAEVGGRDTPYSFGGKPVAVGATPWQAQLYRSLAQPKGGEPLWRRQHNCGGVLIAPDWVLTAGHCVDDIIDDKDAGWRVRLGVTDLSKEEGTTYVVDRWVRNSRYMNRSLPNPPPNMYANDIGLVHIRADERTRLPADPKRIQAIDIYRQAVPGGAEVTAIGWGMTELAPKSFSAVPLKVDLQVMPQDVCRSRPGYGPERIGDAVICAAKEQAKTCRGDSGGPVILTNTRPAKLVGLVSWGKRDCTGDGQPSVFTRVQSHLDWIAAAMKLDPTRGAYP